MNSAELNILFIWDLNKIDCRPIKWYLHMIIDESDL